MKGAHLYKHGLSKHPLYGRWHGMIQRCTDPNSKAYRHYGGRGVKVCDRWLSFPQFLADMGEPPVGGELDRIDKNGDYCPENCKWSSRTEQMRNTRRNVNIEFAGKTQCLAAWAQELGLKKETLVHRIESGWPLDVALTPQKFNTRRKPINAAV